jgi:hypothetical protein
LRVHAAHALGLNCPILGDDLYGKKDQRLYLHASEIGFEHPVSKEWLVFEREADWCYEDNAEIIISELRKSRNFNREIEEF